MSTTATVSNQEEIAASVGLTGAVKGGAIGLIAGLAGGALLNARVPLFRNLTIPGKVFLISSSAVAGFWIGGDKALTQFARDPKNYDKRQVTESHVATIPEQQVAKAPTFLGVEQRTWLKYRYHIVGATWAASVAGSLAWTLRQKHARFSQRLVQARVYSQFMTIAALLGTAFLVQFADVQPEEDERQRKY